jgi:hypothetical protein
VVNELESLGVNTLEKNGLNNYKEASDLTEAIKQTLYEDYLQAYSQNHQYQNLCLKGFDTISDPGPLESFLIQCQDLVV